MEKRNQAGGMNRPRMVFRNEQIKAPNIVIVDEEKGNLGTFPRLKALEMAKEEGMDLIQISYNPEQMVSTVKMMDYGKYMYQKQKDEKEKKKNQKNKGVKELKLKYNIGENDLQMKLRKAEEFINDGYSVKFLFRLRGRERIYSDKAIERLYKIKDGFEAIARPQYNEPKKEAQGYSILLFPKAN